MAAALVRRCREEEGGGVLRPTDPARDLSQIAELVELCFGPRLDSNGLAAVREMKAIGRLGPLIWLIALLDPSGMSLGRGFVWRADGRVIGNISLYPSGEHPHLGRGWLIANVAVHPDYRQRGIARALVTAAIDLAASRRYRWLSLQVEADNEPAFALYRRLGFQTYETLDQWEAEFPRLGSLTPPEPHWGIRRRVPHESAAEADLILQRSRIGAMAWTQPISLADIYDRPLGYLLGEPAREHWAMPDPAIRDRLAGALWIEKGWWRSRWTLFLDPHLHAPEARQALLLHALTLPGAGDRIIRIEALAADPPIADMLLACGFRRTRTLIQMRYEFA